MTTKRAWSLLVAISVVLTVVAGLKVCPNGFVESSPHFVSLNGLKCFNMTGLGSSFWKSQHPLPLEDGVHYASGSGFRVWAPHASSVWVNATLKSSGNHVVSLKQEGYGTWFNNVGGVQAGDTYTFIINYQSKNYTRLDPFAYALDQVTDSVYTQSVVADLSFDWGNTTIPSFSLDQIVIYEMQIPTFNPSSSNGVGTFQQAISKLDYLKELGVTIIEPIPINTYSGGARGWGYNPTAPNTIMNAFGGLNGFRQFVMACHQRGMGVFVDVVWNHMGSPNILALYDGWSQAQPGFPTNSGPPQGIYFYQDENAVTEWGPRPNYGDPHVQTLIYDSITFLLKECRVSGFRWDSTICIRKGGTECWYEPDDLMDGYKMLQKANSIIDSFHGISIAEDLQGNQTVVTAVNKGGIGFTSQWDDNSYYQLHDVLGSQADSSRDINEYAQMLTQGDLTRTIYTENHDKASGQNAGQGRWPNIVDSSQPTSYIAQKLSTLGIATVFTAPGIPLIFYGQEFLDSQNFVFGDVPNLDWSQVGDFSGGKWNSIGPFNGIFNMTQDLIALRLNQVSGVDSSSLMTSTIFTYQLSQQNKVLAFTRGSNNNLVVLMNLSSVAYNSGYIIGAPAAGSWSIVFNSDLKKYSSAFGGVGTGVSSISSQPNSYGPFSNSINVPLGAYSCVILVRN